MLPFLIAARSGWFAEGRFLGKVLDEWINDSQEFIRLKLPHLLLAVIIAFVLFRLLSVVSARMVRIAEQHAAAYTRVAQVRTMAGVIRATGLTIIIAIVTMQFLAAVGVNLAPLLASAGVAGVAIGLAAQNIVRARPSARWMPPPRHWPLDATCCTPTSPPGPAGHRWAVQNGHQSSPPNR